MSYTFKQLTPEEFTVNGYRIYKDVNGQWISSPPIESTQMQKAVNNYINALEHSAPLLEERKRVQPPKKGSLPRSGRRFRKLRSRTGTL